MATITPTTAQHGAGDVRARGNAVQNRVSWAALTEADTAASIEITALDGKATYQVTGTFGGATITLQGSHDDTTFFTVTDSFGTAVSLTAAAGGALAGLPPYVKPVASGGSSQSLNIFLAVTELLR